MVRPEDGNYLELKMSHQAMKTQRSLKRRLQRKRSQSEKTAYCMISILRPSGNGKAMETVSGFSGFRWVERVGIKGQRGFLGQRKYYYNHGHTS